MPVNPIVWASCNPIFLTPDPRVGLSFLTVDVAALVVVVVVGLVVDAAALVVVVGLAVAALVDFIVPQPRLAPEGTLLITFALSSLV